MIIVVGISGASGAIYGVRLLEVLAARPETETHLVMSTGAETTIRYETGRDPADETHGRSRPPGEIGRWAEGAAGCYTR